LKAAATALATRAAIDFVRRKIGEQGNSPANRENAYLCQGKPDLASLITTASLSTRVKALTDEIGEPMDNIKNSSQERFGRPGGESSATARGTCRRPLCGEPPRCRTADAANRAANVTADVANRAANAAQRAGEGVKSAYEDTRQAVNDAYQKTSETLNNTYDQAMTYGKDNPGKLTLIAFGAGIGIGLLLASNVGRGRSRSSQ
jgi:ElaB/YqjD/DUF883 family membrane-anchored ribosome-binding protein